MPGEFIADIVLLPTELFRRACYLIDPPLNEYISRKDLKGLEKQLIKGADPDFDSLRHPGGPPLVFAKSEFRYDAVKLLIKFGAKIRPEIFRYAFSSDLEILQFLLSSEQGKGFDFNTDAKNVVIGWTRSIDKWNSQKEVDGISSCIMLLLEHGASPNALDETGLSERKTALDLIMRPELEEIDLSRLIKCMKEHGALTYEELWQAHHELPHLEIQGEVHPMFQQVVCNLKEAREVQHYLVSTQYSGLDCPVLVIDRKVKNKSLKEEPRQYVVRKELNVYKRQSPTAWQQTGEFMDLPAMYRIVLTPPGVKLPSRLANRLPTECFLYEIWRSTPEYEIYVEGAFDVPGVHAFAPDYDLLQAITNRNNDIVHEWPSIPRYETRWVNDTLQLLFSMIQKSKDVSGKGEKSELLWLKKVEEILAQNGLNGNWLPMKPVGKHYNRYAFSSRRTLEDIPENYLDFVPYPDEIIIFFNKNTRANPQKSAVDSPAMVFLNGKNGTGYWNYFSNNIRKYPNFLSVKIYYGDEVSEATVSQIWQSLSALIK